MCQYSAAEKGAELGRPTDWHYIHYGARALGAVGAIIVEATAVTVEGRISIGCLSLHDDDQIPSFAQLADLIHAGGAKAFIQLNHAGRKASSPRGWEHHLGQLSEENGGWQTVAPSSIPFAEGEREPFALDGQQIEQTIAAFEAAAVRAIEAGFDGVQIHGAHGYLIHQFLSPASNTRTDQWGGSFENRTRFLRTIVRRLRDIIGNNALLVRLSATDWVEDDARPGARSWTVADSQILAVDLARDGIDMVNISTGGNQNVAISLGPGYQVEAAAAVRDALRESGADIPVSVAGIITQAQQAASIVESQLADVVEVGRPLLSDPMLARAWASALDAEAAPMPVQYLRAFKR